MTLSAVLTLAEAAERLRISPHGLGKIGRRTGHCSQVGRKLLFSEADLEAIWQELRVPARSAPGASGPPLAVQSVDIERRAAELLVRGRKRPAP